MGTRYEDQPAEHWAGAESLDPTPVWKQFALIGIFLALGLVLAGGVAVFAAAPQLVTPPALTSRPLARITTTDGLALRKISFRFWAWAGTERAGKTPAASIVSPNSRWPTGFSMMARLLKPTVR